MAARLTVIVAQAATRDARMTDLEETLVAELMMRAGMDATMVGPLEQIQTDDTDFLCVSSFNHNLALLGWLEAKEVRVHWERLGLTGEVVDVSNSANTNSHTLGARRIYYVQLSPDIDVEATFRRLTQVLMDRQVSTFALGLPGQQTSRSSEPDSQAAGNRGDVLPAAGGSSKPVHSPKDHERISPFENSVSANEEEGEIDEPEWQHLDKLVDDFDSLDL